MKITVALKFAALVGAAVFLALLTVQGTLALWGASTVSTGQSLQSADFRVNIATSEGTGRLDAVQAVTLPAASGMMPGTSRIVPVTVTNATNAGSGAFKTRITAGAPEVSGPLANHLTAAVSQDSNPGCSAAGAGNSIDLAQNASGVFCIRMMLSPDAPATLGGSSAAVTVTLTAQQQ